jgi:hypothetical protein
LLELLTRRLLGNLLQSSPLFQEFDAHSRQELAQLFEIRRAPRGMVLAEIGKVMDGLYINLTGTLEVHLARAAELRVASIQNLPEGTVAFQHRQAEIGEGASLQWALAQLGSRLVRSRVDNRLVGDRSRLLDQPEFADAERLREVLRALDEKQRLLALLDKLISARGVRVAIGEELGDPGVVRCAVIAEQLGPAPLCGLGVIGPVRMRYDRIIPMVRYVSGKLAPALA